MPEGEIVLFGLDERPGQPVGLPRTIWKARHLRHRIDAMRILNRRKRSMKFENHVRNDFGKTDVPENTIRRIVDGFARMGLEIQYAPHAFSERIHWSKIGIFAIQLECEGKGVTPPLAKASAHAEMAERFSGGLFFPAFEERVRFNMPALYSRQVDRFLNYEWMDGYVHSHQDDLAGDHLPIESLLRNQSHLGPVDLQRIKASRMARHWVNGYSAVQDKTVKVPVNFVSYISGSNGMAAGNTLEEAVVQATCEVFERHTQIQIIKPEAIVPSIDKDSVKSQRLRAMMAAYEKNNVDILLKDFSMGGRFPAVGVLFVNHNLPAGKLEHKVLIPGVSFDPEEALSRCLTEYMQGRGTLSASRPGLDRPVVHRSRISNLYLMFKCGVSPKDISFLEKGETVALRGGRKEDLLSEIGAIKTICRNLGTDFIVLDLTHPVLGFPVVRVIVPGFSDFLAFVPRDILTSVDTRPDSAWRGERFKGAMDSFFGPA